MYIYTHRYIICVYEGEKIVFTINDIFLKKIIFKIKNLKKDMSMGRMISDFYFIPNVEFQLHVVEDLYE